MISGKGMRMVDAEARIVRLRIEIDLQNQLGPISNIADFTTAELYGMRDRMLGVWNKVRHPRKTR